MLGFYTQVLIPELFSIDRDFSPAYVQAIDGVTRIMRIAGEESVLRAYLTGDESGLEAKLGTASWKQIVSLANKYERATWVGSRGGLDTYLSELDRILSRNVSSERSGQMGKLYTRPDIINDSTLARDVRVEKIKVGNNYKLRFYWIDGNGKEIGLYDKNGNPIEPVDIVRSLNEGEEKVVIQKITEAIRGNSLNGMDATLATLILNALENKKIHIFKNNKHGIFGSTNGIDEIYIAESLLDIKNPLSFFHEIGELLKNQIESKTGINAHIYLRGCGKDIRTTIATLEKIPDNPNYLISELLRNKQLIAVRALKNLPAITPEEMKLIYHNASLGRKGKDVIYGLQDRIFGQRANDNFSDDLQFELSREEVTARQIDGEKQGMHLQEIRQRLIADRLGIKYDNFDAWKRSNPDRYNLIRQRLDEVSEMDIDHRILLKDIDGRYVVIARDDSKFSHILSETEEIVKRLLAAAEFNPDNFNFYLLDSKEENAFVLKYGNNIFVNIGLIKFIVENGGSKDALAFVLAHEIRHLQQWVDDCIAGKPIERGINALIGMHADEYDADHALALIDKAGYSVRDASFFFIKFLEKKGKPKGASLGFLTHPPTVQRLRRIERKNGKFFWANFFQHPDYFSDESKQELKNKTDRRTFQERVLRDVTKHRPNDPNSFDEINQKENEFVAMAQKYLNEAQTINEYLFVVKRALGQDFYRFRINELYEHFLKKFNLTQDSVAGEAHNILFTYFERMYQSSQSFLRGERDHQYHAIYSGKRMGINDLKLLLSIELVSPVIIDDTGENYSIDYADYIRSLCSTLSASTDYFDESSEESISHLFEIFKLFIERYKEFTIYGQVGFKDRQRVDTYLKSIGINMIKIATAYVKSNGNLSRENLNSMLLFLDFLEDTLEYDSGPEIMQAFCGFMKTTPEENKNVILDWISRGSAEKSSRFRKLFFETMIKRDYKGNDTYVFNYIDLLPGMGKDAETDLDVLFQNAYFVKQMLFSDTGSLGWGSNAKFLTVFLSSLRKRYNLSPIQYLRLYENAINKIRKFALTKDMQYLYIESYRRIRNVLSENETILQSLDLQSNLHPRIKIIMYFLKIGGVLTPSFIRDQIFDMKKEIKDKAEAELRHEDIQALYDSLISLADGIKNRYEKDDRAEAESYWNQGITSFALFLSFDKEALNEDEATYRGGPYQNRNRLGRFLGRLDSFHIKHGGDGVKTKVERGRGYNRVYMDRQEAKDILSTFNYIIDSRQNFEELLGEITKILPGSVYRNFALYVLFVEKFLKQECGISIDATKMFDLAYIQNIIDNLNLQDKARALQDLGRISSLMVRDTEMGQLNQPSDDVLGKLEDTERQRILAEHASEETSYYPFEFTELGGALSQLDIFVGLLAENNILGALKSTELSFGEKLDLILKQFTRDSNTRDRFLTLLIENNLNTATSADIEKVLPLFNNESFREKYAVVALEKKRSENPAEFSTLEGELKWILHYFPELSPTRDDILLQLIDEKVNTPGDTKKIRPYLLKAPENIREKKQARVVFGTSVFEEYMRNQNAADKMEFLLWVLGISDKKPFFLKRFEHEYNVSLNGMRDGFMKRRAGYYKNVGDSALEEFLERIFLWEKGIFYDEKVSGEFLDVFFNTLMPNQKNNIMRVVYDAIFRRSDINRKYAIVAALLKNFSREKSSPEGINEARAIRIFLESLGLIGVKIAQFLSTYEVVPENVRNELKLLKDRAPQLSKDIVFDMIAKIYGSFEDSPISEVLECIGSASIKVVYRARLKDGREIVIKIKRPEVEKKVEEDLAFLRDILSDQTVQDALRANDVEIPQQLGNRIAEMILEEMNLKGEVQNQARLREGVSPASSFRRRVMNRIFNYFISKVFKTPQRKYSFKVPATIDVQNNTLIIEDFVSGRRIGVGDEDAMVAVARELMRQIFLDGFYHADPHTGNIFVDSEGGVIYFIDVGSASQISLKNRYLLYQLMKALESGDGKKVLRVINKMAGQSMPELSQSVDNIAASRENVVKKIIMVFKALEDAHVTVDKELISIFRCFGQGETLFRAALLSEGGPSTGPSAKGSSPIDRGFEGDVAEVDSMAFSEAWKSGRSVDISQEDLDVLQDSSMGPAFRVPQVRLISRQAMDGVAQGANVVRLGNQVLVVGNYWNSLSEDERLDILMHEGMADWLERERSGMPAEDAAIDLEGLKRNEAERRAGHRGEGQQTENANKPPEDLSRSSAGEVTGSPIDQRVDTSESAKTQTSSGQVDKKGGIDFRALPIVNQQINMGMLKLSPADLNRLGNINLDSEWAEIQNMVNAGIIPSNERVKEYVLASCLRQNLGNQMNKVLGCIADIMRMEEDRVVDADTELKDMLVLIEAGKPETELQCGLSQIKISPQELQLITP
jgi:ubiquinone biosynthesis protein